MDANYNLASLVDRVRARLKDADFSTDDITQFINDAYFEVLGETHYNFTERKYEATAVEGGELTLPCDFQTLIHFTASDSHGLRPMIYKPAREFFDVQGGSHENSFNYTVFSNKLLFDLPKIESNADSDYYNLSVYYLAKPLKMAGDDARPLIPAEYAEILVLSALARCERLRDNFDYAQIYENKCDDLIINMKERYCPRQMDEGNRSRLPLSFRSTGYGL